MTSKLVKKWHELQISDDYMFCLLMADNEVFDTVVSALLQKEFNGLKTSSRKKFEVGIGTKTIEVDGYGEDQNNNIYNVEMQNYGGFNIFKRIRFASSVMDVYNVSKGQSSDILTENNVIFICTKDIGRIKNYQYIKNLKEYKLNYYIFNANYYQQVQDPKLKALLAYIYGVRLNHPIVDFLDQKINEIKKNEVERKKYMDTYFREKAIKNEGRKEGIKVGGTMSRFRTIKI